MTIGRLQAPKPRTERDDIPRQPVGRGLRLILPWPPGTLAAGVAQAAVVLLPILLFACSKATHDSTSAAKGPAERSVAASGVSFSGDIRPGGGIESLSLPALDGNGSVSYEQFRDRPLVLNFYASWCPFCIAEMPAFQRVYAEAAGRVAFLGVSNSDAREASLELIQRTGVTYPSGMDPRGEFFQATGSLGMPTTLFILPGGRITYIQVGPMDEGTLKDAIRQYLHVSL